MTPDRQRKAAERARKKERGLVAVTVWVRPEHREAIKECAAKLSTADILGGIVLSEANHVRQGQEGQGR